MKEHEIIIYHLITFLVIFIIANWLSKFFHKKHNQDDPKNQQIFSRLESEKNFKLLLRAGYLVLLSLIVDSIDAIIVIALKFFQSTTPLINFSYTQEKYMEAWIIFWTGVAIIHLVEFI